MMYDRSGAGGHPTISVWNDAIHRLHRFGGSRRDGSMHAVPRQPRHGGTLAP